jgi:hypothetical protein
MTMQSSSFILVYASLARAPQLAMTLASRMAATAGERSDGEGAQRWTRCYDALQPLYAEPTAELAGDLTP